MRYLLPETPRASGRNPILDEEIGDGELWLPSLRVRAAERPGEFNVGDQH
jgi:hypothetical protein